MPLTILVIVSSWLCSLHCYYLSSEAARRMIISINWIFTFHCHRVVAPALSTSSCPSRGLLWYVALLIYVDPSCECRCSNGSNGFTEIFKLQTVQGRTCYACKYLRNKSMLSTRLPGLPWQWWRWECLFPCPPASERIFCSLVFCQSLSSTVSLGISASSWILNSTYGSGSSASLMVCQNEPTTNSLGWFTCNSDSSGFGMPSVI